ncbi:MAG: ATP-binding protein [Archangium sp.]|nr:ATP-binding protein [Archangium sp.]
MNADQTDHRVLVLAPTGRDGELSVRLLGEAGITAHRCASMQAMIAEMARGAAAALVTEEALTPESVPALLHGLHRQPPWSDFPVLVFTSGSAREDHRLEAWLREIGNVTLIDRPVRIATLISQMRAAQRARARQYEARDVLERLQRQEAQLRASDRAKDQFLATVSHELRTPLTAILGWVQLLVGGRMTGESALTAYKTIERNARAQAQLVEDLLDVSRVIAGSLRLEVKPFELCAVISLGVESMRPAAQAKGVTLLTIGLDQSVPMVGDAARVQQIVWNLVSNAIKFTPAGGRVEVEVTAKNDHHRITVRDTGDGIDPGFLPYVFDRFRQEDGSSTRRQGGLGLGLAIVRHLAELHGGTVSAHSDGPGKGATVAIELPDPRSPVSVELGVAAPHVDPEALRGVRVLVVEDQRDTREMIAVTLERFGAQVITSATVKEAREAVALDVPDLIVSDIAMPGEDGYSFLRMLRASGKLVPAVALTALANSSDRRAALHSGFDAHLAKPIDGEQLATTLAELWHEHRRKTG